MIPSRQADAGRDSRLRHPAWAILLALLPVLLLVLLLLTIPRAVVAVQEPGETLVSASLGPILAPAVPQAPARDHHHHPESGQRARRLGDGLVKGEPIR